MKFVLRDYQNDAVEATFKYLRENETGNGIIALPTGTGKSLIIADFIEKMLKRWPDKRVIMSTHVKELVKQNAQKLVDMWPEAPLGIYSAGLKRKEAPYPVVFGGIGSMRNNVADLGFRDILIVDECHLISPKVTTTYRKFIDELTKINPLLRVIGLTATPWRSGQGMLTGGDGIFNDIFYDQTTIEAFNQFILKGYLAPLIPKRTNVQLDVSGVKTLNGDYQLNELQSAVDKSDVTWAALQEAVIHGKDRESWIAFASGVEHAEHIADMLGQLGVSAIAIHGKLKSKDRDLAIQAFKNGDIRCAVSNNVLTTGFDHPPVDMIIMLRPSQSSGLWVQMLGRGTRPSPKTGKENCLVLDFAKNTETLGPINDPVIPKTRKPGDGSGTAPCRICEHCGNYNVAAARVCFFCDEPFEFQVKLLKSSGSLELIKADEVDTTKIEYFNIDRVYYSKYMKPGMPPQIKIEYLIGLKNPYKEYIQPEHKSDFTKRMYHDWFDKRHAGTPPETVDEFLKMTKEFRVPKRIKVWTNKKPHVEILGCEF